MKVKRYLAQDMRRALARIRDELGEDAVILSNRSLEDGVEVVAAALAQTPHEAEARPSSQSRQQAKVDAETPAAHAATAAVTIAAPDSPEMMRMRSELNGIRHLLDQRLGGMAWEQFARRTPMQANIWERLNAMGIPAALSRSLLESVRPDHSSMEGWRFTIASLSRRLPVMGTDIAAGGGIFALLGPTGVGKTTTIGKLATRYVLEHGSDAVALVTTDSYRVAAHEQLRAFGRILNVSVRVVDQHHSLRETLDSLGHKSLILIDTAGLHARDPALTAQLQTLGNCSDVQKLLVMACTSQGTVLANSLKTYGAAGLGGCILSKLDEAGTMGEALALAIDHRLPIAYETHGQGIPHDISVAQAHRLVSKAVALSIRDGDEKERLIYEFGHAFEDDHADIGISAMDAGVVTKSGVPQAASGVPR